ncbi:MAG: polysaccharide biosynthesis protein [Clostridia bacterium]|nr:polysaccharide biosynthesis protein [Clostridia bacterium]
MNASSEKQPVRRGFMLGALILSLSGFLSKLCGAIFKIPLTNLVGMEAMGYFGSAYAIYNFLLALATAGIPTGISTMIAKSIARKKYKDISTVLKIAAMIFLIFSSVLTVLGLAFAGPLAEMMNSADAYWCMLAIMPAVFFITVVAIFRGFFQGHNNMVPTAVTNVIEAFLKLVAGYGFALILHLQGYSPPVVVGGAMAGVTFGTIISALFMLIRYMTRGVSYRLTVSDCLHDESTPRKTLTKQFLGITFPIMLSSITANLMSALDAFFVVNRMELYMTSSEANLRWGCYSSGALTIFNLPSFFIISIGTSLVPSISMAYARKDKPLVKNTLDSALKYSAILAFGFGFGLSAVAEGAVRLFYGRQSEEAIAIATVLLEIVSFALVCVGLTNVTASILQSVGKAHMSVVSVAVGSVVKTLFTFLLVSIPGINVSGAPISTNIAYPIMLLMNLFFIRKYLDYTPKIGEVLLKPLLCAGGCYGAVKCVAWLMGDLASAKWAVFPQIIVGVIVYFALIFALKLLTFCEIRKTFKKTTSAS